MKAVPKQAIVDYTVTELESIIRKMMAERKLPASAMDVILTRIVAKIREEEIGEYAATLILEMAEEDKEGGKDEKVDQESGNV